MVSLEVTYNITGLLSVLPTTCHSHQNSIKWARSQLKRIVNDYKFRIVLGIRAKAQARLKRSTLGDIGGLLGSANSMLNSGQIYDLNDCASWVAAETARGLHYSVCWTGYALISGELQGDGLLQILRQTADRIIDTAESEATGGVYDMLSQDLIDGVKSDIEDIRFGTIPEHMFSLPIKPHKFTQGAAGIGDYTTSRWRREGSHKIYHGHSPRTLSKQGVPEQL
ncbi:uncharacterized protein LOC121269885 [Carcharodon carcharias]|uniref:uncharacterized protein LOC121269885 n=1 Tax=Carcharodon carcharias TaxID=13397 RepID=UPI001B7EE3A1|nr:uncharacterized protein LOC121269885 [Carcharodon carcharias]